MAKAIVCVGATQVANGEASISYTVSVIKTGSESFSYGSDYQVSTAITLNNNLIAWRNKVIAQAAEKGVVLSASDVIVFGAPS